MSNFAIIPWAKRFEKDNMFDVLSSVNRDNLLEPYMELKLEFERHGHSIHTIDCYDRYEDVDFFLFFSFELDKYEKIEKDGFSSKMVYCTAEPPSVCWYNSKLGYVLLRHIFPYILTWNDDWVDNVSVFKRNIPYWFVDQRDGNLPYEEKRLITSISGNKTSRYKGELYSERKKAIRFFEKNHPEDFRFYGVGWNKEEHPTYEGKAESKAKVYHQYRFALCFENIEGLKGYVTEKILDCLMSGVIPIYAGADDVDRYVPRNCYIRLRDFDGYEELYDYLSTMGEATYNNYLLNASEYIESEKLNYFSGARYARYILDAVSHDKSDFKSSKKAFKMLNYANYFHDRFCS